MAELSAPSTQDHLAEEDEEEEADAYSSSSASFQSPPSSDNEMEDAEFDDDDNHSLANNDTSSNKPSGEAISNAAFALPSMDNSTPDSPGKWSSQEGLATQPPQPSSPPAQATATSNTRPNKRKVSASPIDSLAQKEPVNNDNNNNKTQPPKRRTSPRKAQNQNPQGAMDTNDATGNNSPLKGRSLVEAMETPNTENKSNAQGTPNTQDVSQTEAANETKSANRKDNGLASLVDQVETPPKLAGSKDVVAAKKKNGVSSSQSVSSLSTASAGTKKSKRTKTGNVEAAPPKKKGKKASGSASTASSSKKGNKGTATETPASQSSKTSSSKKSNPKTPDPKSKKDETAAKTTPSSAKKKKRSFQDELLHHLFVSCKPYTAKTLAQVMKTNESSVNFCLLSLTDKDWVVKKEFTSKGGRSKELYWANQDAKSKELFDSLRSVPAHEIEATRQELVQLQHQDASISNELALILKTPSNDEVDAHLKTAQSELSELENKRDKALERIREASKEPQGPAGKGKKQPKNSQRHLKIRINKMRDEWRKRKEKCTDFIEQLADGMEKKVKDVVKLLELETDESEGVKMPPKYAID